MMKSPMSFKRPRGRMGMMYQNGGKQPDVFYLGQDLSRIYRDDNGNFYVYNLTNEDGFDYEFNKDNADRYAQRTGMNKLFIPKYDDGTPKTSRDRYQDFQEGQGMDDDYFEPVEVDGKVFLLPTTTVDVEEGEYIRNIGESSEEIQNILQRKTGNSGEGKNKFQNGGQVDYMDEEGNRQNPPDEQRRPGPTRRDNVMGGGRMGDSGPASAMPVGEGEVMEDEDGRNYVLFENPDDPNGEPVKVYSDNYGWNEVEGKMKKTEDMRSVQIIRMDMDYPIKMNEETGEYELDAGAYEEMLSKRDTDKAESGSPFRGSIKREMENPGENPRGAPPVGCLLEQLKQLGSRGQTRKAMGGMRVLKR